MALLSALFIKQKEKHATGRHPPTTRGPCTGRARHTRSRSCPVPHRSGRLRCIPRHALWPRHLASVLQSASRIRISPSVQPMGCTHGPTARTWCRPAADSVAVWLSSCTPFRSARHAMEQQQSSPRSLMHMSESTPSRRAHMPHEMCSVIVIAPPAAVSSPPT